MLIAELVTSNFKLKGRISSDINLNKVCTIDSTDRVVIIISNLIRVLLARGGNIGGCDKVA